MEKARKSGNKNMKYSEAFEEFVADSMEKMLTDQNAVEKLAMLRTKDKSVFDKLREGIQKLVDRIKQEYAKLTPDSAEGRTVATMTDVFSDIQDLFLEALDDASNNFQKAEKNTITNDGVKYSLIAKHIDDSIWKNVDYNDNATKTKIMRETHQNMVNDGIVVEIAEGVKETVAESYPDLRSMKKKDRTPILKEAMNNLKSNLRTFLNGFKNQSFEFDVSGKVLEAKLYNTGINEVLEKITQDKAEMLYSTKEIFRNARYLYSTPDYDGDPNVYRWNYFYTPVKIGENIVGVRIAIRDVVKGTKDHLPESQIYNWGIKKDTPLDGESHGPKVASSDVSSDVSINIIPNDEQIVKKNSLRDVKEFNSTAIEHFGRTFSWKETSYLLTNGSKLDFSGKNMGGKDRGRFLVFE